VSRNPEEFKAPLPDGIQSGLPSQLLDNRPDVRQAALELEAAKLDVKVAKAAFYPSLSIDAGVGYRSFNAQHLVTTPESLAYGVAGNVTAPLLNEQRSRRCIARRTRGSWQAVFNLREGRSCERSPRGESAGERSRI